MAKMKFKRKINWKGVISAVLCVFVVLGAIAGITAITKNDTKTISSLAFSKGGLDEEGKYLETEQSIFTKDAFNCIGLRVEPDFKFNGTYDVYYYDYNGHFVHKVEGLTSIYDEDFPLAKMARIVIYPAIPSDVDEDDFKIAFYEVGGIADQFKISVLKDQKYKYESLNLYDAEKAVDGLSFAGSDIKVGEKLSEHLVEGVENSKATEEISVEYENYDIFVRYGEIREVYTVGVALTADDVITAVVTHNASDSYKGEWVKLTIDVPEDSDTEYLRVRLPSTAECYIFGYND